MLVMMTMMMVVMMMMSLKRDSHLFWSALPGHNITVQIEFPRLVSHAPS